MSEFTSLFRSGTQCPPPRYFAGDWFAKLREALAIAFLLVLLDLSQHGTQALVGDGPQRREIKARIAQSCLAERFRLTGLLPPEQLPAVMHATDIFAHCSIRDGLARALPRGFDHRRMVDHTEALYERLLGSGTP